MTARAQVELPELPDALCVVRGVHDELGVCSIQASEDYYNADQMRAYAQQAIAESEETEYAERD